MPRISVIMPVYNNAPFVQESISSILRQTFADLELIIIDDGSTDGSTGMIYNINDERVKKIFHPVSLGVAASLNQGLDVAQGEYIARMDGDDIAALNRLEVQAYYMDQHPDIDVCGTAYTQNYLGPVKFNPLDHEEIKAWLLFHCCILHPSVMMRKSSIERVGIRYDLNYPHAEDFELWTRLSFSGAKLANIPHNLMYYRSHPGQVSNTHRLVQDNSAKRIRQRHLSHLDLQLSEEDYSILVKLAEYRVNPYDFENYHPAAVLANWIVQVNSQVKAFNQEVLQMAFSRCLSRFPY
ncbi:glycosyltransferase family 2 protein [Paenibacillus illinoisensis]|uniref:Glycosyltransferase n=1 Tax=Paenibacillus illinoisensis TaxID=59845 RepID=A0A2W0CDP1_9BACL|nr:glycosyltransferase [Paenibacillus illinoisensis]PYY25908.1 Glycosyltransferase [Paenibacillus illinoisensis]